MRLRDKLAEVTELLRAGYQRHFGELEFDEDDDAYGTSPTESSPPGESPAVSVESPEQARHILEVTEDSTLDEVREAYRRLARAYHPQTLGTDPESIGAQRLMGTLLEALELLEEHLLPLPPPTSNRRQGAAESRR